MSARVASTMLLGFALVGCGKPYQFADAPIVPESVVINGVKCELGRFLAERAPPKNAARGFFLLDETQFAEVDLTLKTTRARSASLGASGVIPLNAGSVTPFLNLSISESDVITGTTQFVIQQHQANDRVACPKGGPGDPAFGLADWLLAKFASEKDIVAGEPRVGLGKIIISSDFGVRSGGEFGAKAVFVPVSVTPQVAASTDNVQSLKITLRGAHVQQPFKDPDAPKQPGNPTQPRKTLKMLFPS